METKMNYSKSYSNPSDMVITSIEDFRNIISEFEASCNNIRNIIEKEKNNAEIINGTEAWTGKAAEALYQKYSLLNSNYDQIDYSLDIYTKFLWKTAQDYESLLREQESNINAMESSLDVNS